MPTQKGHRAEIDTTKYIVFSRLISRYYDADTGAEVEFSGGIDYVREYIYRYIDEDREDKVLLYIDLVFDNKYSVRDVVDILKIIVDNNLRNITPLPIPCIEYYASLSLGDKSKEDYKILSELLPYRESKTCKNNVPNKFVSFEKYCKAAVSVLLPARYTTSIPIDKFDSMFVYEDSIRLVNLLPAYYLENDVMSCGKIVDKHKIYFELINFFKYQTEKLNEYSVADKMVNEIMDVGDKFVQMWEK
jgi:hypothetical protein